MTTTIARYIRNIFNKLTPREKKVARVLLEKYPVAGLETVSELADRAGIGNATVLRFVNKLGYKTYADFQRTLRDEIEQGGASPLTQYDDSNRYSDLNTYINKFIKSSKSNLHSVLNSINREDFDEIIRLLSDNNRTVFFIGGRFTQFIANYIAWHLGQIRKKVRAIDGQPESWVDQLIDINRRSVLVVFDFRRYQDDVVAFAHLAAGRGAKIILITDEWISPIAVDAHSVWCCPVDIPSPYDSALPGLALGECIIGGVVHHNGDLVRQRIEDIDVLRQQLAASNKNLS